MDLRRGVASSGPGMGFLTLFFCAGTLAARSQQARSATAGATCKFDMEAGSTAFGTCHRKMSLAIRTDMRPLISGHAVGQATKMCASRTIERVLRGDSWPASSCFCGLKDAL